ncbi:ketoacyl-ACP synthase III [Flavobacterium silvaticum]|uniref:Ketoacyl-ACP synthase III n=1 Tax=Flavobacterium silvaticum TaxID=1852020 RepID=A0A972JJL2_9FLAO|nr:ketoacyl-ACP synthase III [Flavobacterium silvaticum]NMH29503.1 ketoacyl-ACP synthase III [Flavobacterium silvaticum]
MLQQFRGIEIKALSACIPKRIVGNDAFEDLIAGKELRMFERTVGITSRRWAEDGVTATDLGFEAASILFSEHPELKENISALVFLSQTPDYKLPFSSNILQDKLGLGRELLCLDLNAGCAGFVQGLGTAFSLASPVKNGRVLLIIAETMSRMLSYKDRGTTLLFGDGAAAMIIENTGDGSVESAFEYFTDGAHFDAIMIPEGGYRKPATAESLIEKEDAAGNKRTGLNLYMDGARVFDFTLREIAPSITKILTDSDTSKDDVDYFLMHQSNRFIIQQIAAQLGIPSEKALLNIETSGNTSGVSIPLLMSEKQEQVSKGKTLVCSGYGVGLNWANCILKNQKIKFTPLQEV